MRMKETTRNRHSRPEVFLLMLAFLLISWSHAGAITPQVAAGNGHTVGLKSDGTVVATGTNRLGQLNVGSWTDIIQVAAGSTHTLGLKSDGTVVAVGGNSRGQLNVGSWTNIVQVAAGYEHTVGLKSDGKVVAVGELYSGQLNVGSWTNISRIAANSSHTVGLKSDGTVVATGDNSHGQLNVGSWTNIIQVGAGWFFTVGLKSDGTVVVAGTDDRGNPFDVGSWTGISRVAGGAFHIIGLKSDGTMTATGNNGCGQLNVGSWTDIIDAAAGHNHTVGLKSDSTVKAVGENSHHELETDSWYLQVSPLVELKGTMGSHAVLVGPGFGNKKGTVGLGDDPNDQMNILVWADFAIVFQINRVVSPGWHPVLVKRQGEKSFTTYDVPFNIKTPEIQGVEPLEGAPGDVIKVAGLYFGAKEGDIYLGDRECAIEAWYMGPETGGSIAGFIIPNRMPPGQYTLKVNNKVASTTYSGTFTVLPADPKTKAVPAAKR